jgi:hypothetical protein
VLLKIFWVITRRHFLVYLQDLRTGPKTLKMGQTSDPETLVIHQKVTPGNNPEDFKQHYDHGGRLQLHLLVVLTAIYFPRYYT